MFGKEDDLSVQYVDVVSDLTEFLQNWIVAEVDVEESSEDDNNGEDASRGKDKRDSEKRKPASNGRRRLVSRTGKKTTDTSTLRRRFVSEASAPVQHKKQGKGARDKRRKRSDRVHRSVVVQVKRGEYAFEHIDYPEPVPGDNLDLTFTNRSSMPSSTGAVLRTYAMLPRGKRWRRSPRAVLIWLPSLLGHMGRSGLLARLFADAGIAVHGFDFEGTGDSSGERGHIEYYERHVQDILDFSVSIAQLYGHNADSVCGDRENRENRDRSGNKGNRGKPARNARRTNRHWDGDLPPPLFLGGESAGATLALVVAMYYPTTWKGLVLMSPSIWPSTPETRQWLRPTWLMWFLKQVDKFAPRTPWLSVPPVDLYSRNLTNAVRISRDKRVAHGKISAHYMCELVRLVNFAFDHLGSLQVPFICQHGKLDLINDPLGARALYHSTVRVLKDNKTVIWHHNCWHDLLHEPEAEEIVNLAVKFVEDHCLFHILSESLD